MHCIGRDPWRSSFPAPSFLPSSLFFSGSLFFFFHLWVSFQLHQKFSGLCSCVCLLCLFSQMLSYIIFLSCLVIFLLVYFSSFNLQIEMHMNSFLLWQKSSRLSLASIFVFSSGLLGENLWPTLSGWFSLMYVYHKKSRLKSRLYQNTAKFTGTENCLVGRDLKIIKSEHNLVSPCTQLLGHIPKFLILTFKHLQR